MMDTRKTQKPLRRQSERGNVFFTLFGAVAVVGVLGAGIMATMRGPLSTMVEVNNRTTAKSQMEIASKLAMLEAVSSATPDCDGDTYVEPLAPGGALAGFIGGTGGGTLPAGVGSNKIDPWGTEIGYCAWDNGPDNTDACGSGLFNGEGVDDPGDTILAIVSAGPDRVFQTTCDHDPAYVTKGGDDIVMEYNYDDARGATGGLWNIKSGEPTTAEIDKDIDLTDTYASLGGASPQLRLGASSMLLPTDDTVGTQDADCAAGNNLILRVNDDTNPPSLEICDGANTAWVSVAVGAAGLNLWKNDGAGGPTEIYYTADNVGIGTNDPDDPLDVVGNMGLTGTLEMSTSQIIQWGGGVNITGDADSFNVSTDTEIAGDLNITGNFTGTPTFVGDVLITGSTSDNTADALTVEDSSNVDILVVQNDGNVGIGNASPNDKLDVAGNIDMEGDFKVDGNTVLVTDGTSYPNSIFLGNAAGNAAATGDSNTILGAGAGVAVTSGTNNTILGAGAGVTAATGNNNIVIGSHDTIAVDVDAAASTDYLNIGNTLFGDLATGHVGIGFPALTDVTTFNDELEVSGTVHATGNITSGATVAGANVTASTRVTTDELYVNTTDNFVPGTCAAGNFHRWDGNSWECDADTGGGGGAGGVPTLDEVLAAGDDGGTEEIVNVSGIAVGDATVAAGFEVDVAGDITADRLAIGSTTFTDGSGGGGENLEVDITGDIGATNYCDDAGLNCFTAADIIGGGGGKWLDATDANDIYYSAGQVGIGTNDPDQALEVVGTTQSDVFLTGDGAVGAPSYAFQSDATTGLYYDGANGLSFTTNGGNAANILANNDVGIGTATVATGVGVDGQDLLMEVNGPLGATYFCDEDGEDCFVASDVGMEIWNPDGTNDYIEYDDSLGGVRIGKVTGQPAPETDWYIDVAGNVVYNTGVQVGIGTATVSDGSGGGGQNLTLDVEGAVGGTHFCDEDGLNCFVPTDVGAEVNDLEGDGAANIADTEIFIGTGAGTGNYAAMSGDAALANDGALTIGTGVIEPGMLDAVGAAGAGTDEFCLTYEHGTTEFEWTSCSAAAGATVLSSIIAATADNSINNGAWNQVWNWALTAAETAFTFGENTAATGGTTGAAGDQFILEASTLASSTAVPLHVENLGDAYSFQVYDEAGDTTPFVIDEDGNVGIGTAAPADQLHLVGGQIRVDGTAANEAGCIRFDDTTDELEYSDDCASWTAFSDLSLWTDNTTHITRENFHILDAGLAAGSTTAGLDGDGTYAFFDPDKGAFRGGVISGGNDAWQDANVGDNSLAWGSNAEASGPFSLSVGQDTVAAMDGAIALGESTSAVAPNSTALGVSTIASSDEATALGSNTVASGFVSLTTGRQTVASGNHSTALGFKATAGDGLFVAGDPLQGSLNPGVGEGAMAIGLTTDANEPAGAPMVTGDESLGIFMGNQSGYDLSTANRMALVGGDLLIDEDGTTGSQGCIRYNDTADVLEYSDDCSTWASFTSLGAADTDRIEDSGNQDTYIDVDTDDSDGNDTIVMHTAGTERVHITAAGDVGIGLIPTTKLDVDGGVRVGTVTGGATPTFMALDDLDDVNVAGVTDTQILSYNNTSGDWEAIDSSAAGLWTDNTTHITRDVVHVMNTGEALPAGFDADGTRFFFYPDKDAFRGGSIGGSNDAWQEANIGSNSFAFGYNTQASGISSVAMGATTTASGADSFAMGAGTTASGDYSIAMGGSGTTASGIWSTAIGLDATASGYNSYAFGRNVLAGDGTADTSGPYTSAGDASVAFGLIDDAVSITVNPQVTGIQSMGIFMGDQDGVDLTDNNTMALYGGKLLIDEDGTVGSQGCIRYNDTSDVLEYSDDCSTWVSFTSLGAGGVSLSGITAATANNTISNADHLQVWNWQLAADGEAGLTLGESAASTGGAGDQNILVLETLATSTATPLFVENAGAALSFRVNDAAGDTTPFVVDEDGNVGIGTASPTEVLEISRDQASTTGIAITNVDANSGADVSVGLGTDAGEIGLYIANTADGGLSGISTAASGGFNLNVAVTAGITMDTDDVERMVITSGGLTGLGDFTSDTVESALHLQAGDLRLDGGAANEAGCIRFDDTTDKMQFAHDCSTWQDIVGSAGINSAISGLTAATADNTINNGAWNQVWNWQLTGGETAFTFGENVASTGGSGDQFILSASTLASSTAIPLFVENAGTALSFRVNDVASDTTPFVIDAIGAVGMGTATPVEALDIYAPGGFSGIALSNDGTDANSLSYLTMFTERTDLTKYLGEDNTNKGWGVYAFDHNHGTAGWQNDLIFQYYDGAAYNTALRFDSITRNSEFLSSIGVGDFSADTVDSRLHLQTGDIRLDGGAANEAGCIRFNDTSDVLEYADDCSTWVSFTSLGAGGVALNGITAATADNTDQQRSL